ncbi:MAG: gamma-polyglutamic acid synthetase [Synergistaceae bacterium]|nr:gamma-polyglutamic acid synthetase [Synergistaceae bacterium]
MRECLAPFAKYRVLVTGSRGKSSLVRLIFAGLSAGGTETRGRVTGVLPRELCPGGERRIVRNSPGHVEEMRWWLRQIPRDAEAVVMENSAVQPDLQGLAALWLRPVLTVWTNAREDHQDAWGPGPDAAFSSLLRGVPEGCALLLSAELGTDRLARRLKERKGPLFVLEKDGRDYRESNLLLAEKALELLGRSSENARAAMRALPPDIADFRVFRLKDDDTRLAAAFSANDLQSTEHLFSLLGWTEAETSVLFADRDDRRARRESFSPFLTRRWREVRIADKREDPRAITGWMGGGKKVFGCGNVAGFPLEILLSLLKEGCEWTLPAASV